MKDVNDTPVESVVTMLPSKCVPGRWYEHSRWGRVLCCGTADADVWLPAFAVRTNDKRTALKFIADSQNFLTPCDQSW
jgi:hypothetical protein